jgi:thiol:disulfide interchange protein DsbD
MDKKIIIGLFCLIVLFIPLRAQLQSDIYSADPEIKTEIIYQDAVIVFNFNLDGNYHITDLKNNFFKINLEKNEYLDVKKVIFPTGIAYEDEMVFKGEFQIRVLLKTIKKITSPILLKFTVGYQICQETPQEVCFAPDSQEVSLKVEKPFNPVRTPNNKKEDWIPLVTGTPGGKEKTVSDESFFKKIERLLTEELEKKSVLLFLLAFVLGFLTSLTPCVYPVIPIIMGYIGSQSRGNKLKGFYLSLWFVLGLGIVYSLLGLVAAATGSIFGATFQNPVVVVVIASIFILMGLSLAGLFEIPVPSSISAKVQAGGFKSQVIGSLIIGGVAGIIAAPCAGPVLIAILSWISQTRNLVLGFLVMFTFSLGLGVIFVLVGTFTGIISSLPKGGKWMSTIKNIFAILLIIGGILVLGMIVPDWLYLRLWGIFLVGISIFMGLFKPLEDDNARKKFAKLIMVIVLLWGVLLFFISFIPADFTPTQSKEITSKAGLNWIYNLDEGKTIALQKTKMVMIDTYADWCVACKELDKYTFSDPEVMKILNNMVLVKLDFTRRTKDNETLRKSLGVIGMPTIIFLNSQGKEIKRFSGFRDKNQFLKIVNSL